MTVYPITLHGSLVTLREFAANDVADVYAIIGDDRVTKWLSFDSRTLTEAAEMVNGITARAGTCPRTEFYLAITPRDSRRLLGFVRLALSGVEAGKLGYAVHADHWRHGYARDATTTMLNFAFGTLRLHRVSAAIGPDNAASIRLVSGLGFTHEGRIRDHVRKGGSWRDSLLYSVLAPEWAQSAAA